MTQTDDRGFGPTCFRFDGPDTYPKAIGTISRFKPDADGVERPPQWTWDEAEKDWVPLRWTVVPDPRA
jgi:hypothetical protein